MAALLDTSGCFLCNWPGLHAISQRLADILAASHRSSHAEGSNRAQGFAYEGQLEALLEAKEVALAKLEENVPGNEITMDAAWSGTSAAAGVALMMSTMLVFSNKNEVPWAFRVWLCHDPCTLGSDKPACGLSRKEALAETRVESMSSHLARVEALPSSNGRNVLGAHACGCGHHGAMTTTSRRDEGA
eukprot:CAMPEP_0181412270 /NCGR_PEP_ID=MMETSP1110-20121109/8332_1 /TAXON_ID=174948 /ORGANISM="Symbiodinium sp., Strain CCMP421" /LENGTH=187 /DNA_ID=CAMNT_0023534971 /DNA_START=451 /DNA_END=1016 /DNA_ORIENTATION=-